MTSCPECKSQDLQSLGILRGERLDPYHVFLISKYRCRVCSCEFNEVLHSEWTYDITKHGSLERLILMEAQK